VKRDLAIDINKLDKVLEHPELEKDFREIFSFVETITGQHLNLDRLTPQNIEEWDQKFDEVLQTLLREDEARLY
jgi:hypothetical protein